MNDFLLFFFFSLIFLRYEIMYNVIFSIFRVCYYDGAYICIVHSVRKPNNKVTSVRQL